MLRGITTAGKRLFTMSHERSIYVLHEGNRITFDIPLFFENGMRVVNTKVEDGRMIVEALAKPDIEPVEKNVTYYEGCCPKK